MSAGLNTLMNDFFSDFAARTAVSEIALRKPVERKQAVIRPESSDRPGVSSRATVTFYSLYIIACMCVLLYWQFRSSSGHLLNR